MGWVTEHHPDPAGLSACVQCGLCLPVCPTFRLTGRETASPRGRLQAMSAVADGIAEVDAKFEEILDFCLGCRACEPVCPGMVPYGSLLEGARAEIVAQRRSFKRWLRGVAVGRLVGSQLFLSSLTILIRVVQLLHLGFLVPGRFRRTLLGIRPLVKQAPRHRSATAGPGTRVGLLSGCIQDHWFPGVNSTAAELLTRAGFQVVVPRDQTCCGALAAHDGHADRSEILLSKNRDAFADCDLVVATGAGCSAHLRDNLDNALDVTVIIASAIADGRLPALEATGLDVVVQDPCHLRHAQRVVDEPRAILKAAGYSVVDLDDDGLCCGAAGLYTALQPAASSELGERKADLIRATERTLVASANPGCEMQLRGVLGAGYRIAHPIELYSEAIQAAPVTTNVPDVESKP
ncbi:MAG TPA: (Fe-S)-binding protein [Acidimicrobiia bacterium]